MDGGGEAEDGKKEGWIGGGRVMKRKNSDELRRGGRWCGTGGMDRVSEAHREQHEQ